MSEPIRYPCMRCGDAVALDVTDAYTPGVCEPCSRKALHTLGDGDEPDVDALVRWRARYLKGCERHPTWRALMIYLKEEVET